MAGRAGFLGPVGDAAVSVVGAGFHGFAKTVAAAALAYLLSRSVADGANYTSSCQAAGYGWIESGSGRGINGHADRSGCRGFIFELSLFAGSAATQARHFPGP